MLRGDNRTEDKTDIEIEKTDDKVKKAFDDVQQLKDKIERMKVQTEQITAAGREEGKGAAFSDVLESRFSNAPDRSAVEAAEKAVREHAMKEEADEQEAFRKREQEREEKIRQAKLLEQETRERLEIKKREALEKQLRLEEAEKRAEETKRNRKRAELRSLENHTQRDRELREAIEKKEEEEIRLREIESRINREKIVAEKRAAEIAKIEQEKLEEKKRQQRRKEESAAREAEKTAKRIELLEKKKEEARIREEESRRKAEREALIAEQRAIQKRKREEEKAEIRRIRKEREARKNEEKREREARKNEERNARRTKLREERLQKAELRRQRRYAKKSAEIGGGIVNVHGTIIKTEIQPVASFSWKEFMGISKRKEIRATESEEEKQALLEENERIKQEARAYAAQLAEARRIQRSESSFTSKFKSFLAFCDEKKTGLFIAVSVILALAVGTAGIFNYCTAYEYSYNGHSLGYVKNKDDVLHITQLVQSALSEEKAADVVIDARDDIDFERVYTFNKDIVIDSSDEVLKRLTYVGDLNVEAFGIYIGGSKIGAVESKDAAAQVFEDVKNRYATGNEGSEVTKAVIVEDVDVRKCNSSFQDVMSVEEMVEKLCTDGIRTTPYTVVRGDTLESIAEMYNVSREQLLKDNEIPDPEKLEVGSTIIISETAPIMTVRITEVRSYVKKTDYETIKKKDSDMYEGYTEVDQKGQKGVSQIKDRTVTVNGEVVSTKILKESVNKEPVEKIVRVGTKERPPTVGSGTYIWPAYSGTYTVTSEFKWRWGRQHQGIDMGCSTGTDVLAADGGTVTYAGWMGGYGNLVIIDHQNGIETYYGHNSSLCVSKGDKVFQGQHIAEAGNTGHSFGSHIHFGVKDNGTFKNPRNYLP